MACARARSASAPSVFITSQVAPSRAWPDSTPKPQSNANGVAQSNGPPAYAPFSTRMPWIKPPRMTPWQKPASVEPPANAASQNVLLSPCSRNSTATPRNTSASNMTITGR